ncbi:MAG: hypothetical protein Q7R80_00330 [bacterium]|nr:hypothetical protein [bacterium]
MRFVRTFLTWLRARKKATTALTFDTLVERAMRGQQGTSGKEDRPDYLPNPGALSRIALAIGGGLCLYAAIATVVSGFKWGGSWWFLSLGAPVLCMLALRLGTLLRDSLMAFLCDDFGSSMSAVFRTLLWPIIEPLCVILGWGCTYLYYALDRVLPHWEQEPMARELQKATTREDAIRRIPDLIVAIINEERERLFGDASPFAGIRKRIERELEEARKLHAYFTDRAAKAGTVERREHGDRTRRVGA